MTDPYTPTTEEVRAAHGDIWDDYRNIREAEFDRWLAAHDATVRAEGASEMRERAVLAAVQVMAKQQPQSWSGQNTFAAAIRALPVVAPTTETEACCETCDKAKAEGFRADRPSAVPEPTGDRTPEQDDARRRVDGALAGLLAEPTGDEQ